MITFALQLAPKYDKPVMRVAAVHVPDERYPFLCMLVWMGMGATGLRLKGLGCSIISLAEAVDELAVGAVLNGSLSDAVFLRSLSITQSGLSFYGFCYIFIVNLQFGQYTDKAIGETTEDTILD